MKVAGKSSWFLAAGFIVFFLLCSGPARAEDVVCSADSVFFDVNASLVKDKPWVFFDLGAETIVDTTDWTKVHYVPGVVDYIDSLKAHGFAVGLIINIPGNWGTNFSEKFAALKDFLIADGKWSDSREFDWSTYDLVLLPDKDSDRKPAPCLFSAAGRIVGKKYLYIGTIPEEVAMAKELGNSGYSPGSDGNPFLPLEQICKFSGICR